MNASPSFTHKVFVHTADRRGAATSAPVRCTLVGEHGSVDVSIDPATHFARGSVKEFHVSAPGIGAVRAVRLMHDGGAEEDAWLVSQVVVRDAVAQQDAEFPCGFWLDPLSGSTEAELFPHPSGSSKREFEILNRAPPLMQPLGVLLSYAALPHPDKSRLGKDGEDALFVYPERQDQLVRSPYYVMGVADGVAEWALKGVDSGLFSRCLMETARHNAEAGCFSPAQLITAAWGAVSRERIQGSSTACIVSLDGVRGVLRAANLGDSGFMVVREGRVLFRSPEQEHMYGYPFQLSSKGRDMPFDAQLHTMRVQAGDVVLLATDGLFDNLGEKEIAHLVWSYRLARGSQLVEYLVQRAFRNSVSPTADTPFARMARDELNMVVNGGKQDDISVILGKVVRLPG